MSLQLYYGKQISGVVGAHGLYCAQSCAEAGGKALEETLTEEQQALFREYLDQETAAYSLELRHLFCLTLSMGNQLSRL